MSNRGARRFVIGVVAAIAIVRGASADSFVPPPAREIPSGKLDFTPAAPDVAANGQYAPRVELEVLSGAAGMEPALALVYSNRANGFVGAGWSLSTESSIERKGRRGGVADMSSDDTFWLNGQQLVEVADGTFRTEHDELTVYTPIVVGNVVTGWETVADGITTIYGRSGATGDSNAIEFRDEVVVNGTAVGTEPVRWLLSGIRNAFGAEVTYSYWIPDGTARHLPDRIVYAAGANGHNEIQLGYEARGDVRVSYADGRERIESLRLRRIVVRRVSGTTAATSHYYLLGYTEADHSPQSLLSSVRRLDVPGPLSPPEASAEVGWPSELIARFGYEDSATAWGEQEPLQLVGAPDLDVHPSQKYFSIMLVGDTDGDSRADILQLNDLCTPVTLEEWQSRPDMTGVPYFPHYDCVSQHRVFLNTVTEMTVQGPDETGAGTTLRVWRFLYDEQRSGQLDAFFGPLHDRLLNAKPATVADLDRDGFIELIDLGRFAPGGPDGWDITGVPATWTLHADEPKLADIDADGYPDLLASASFVLNPGNGEFPDDEWVGYTHPVLDGHASAVYDQENDDCLDASDVNIRPWTDYGLDAAGYLARAPTGSGFTARDWVWRHTYPGDFNGDGVLDLLVNFPFLARMEDPLCDAQNNCAELWGRDDERCGVFDEIFLGNGRGSFVSAGYGVGGPTSRPQVFHQVREVPIDGTSQFELIDFPQYLNHHSLADLDRDGRGEVTRPVGGQMMALWDRGAGEAPGYGDDAAVPIPEEMFGLSALDFHYSTIEDMDGDGDPDLFQYFNSFDAQSPEGGDDDMPWSDWSTGAQWRENLRTTAQNRLIQIQRPHGGTTAITWSWSAWHPANDLPINVEHVKTVRDGSGLSAFTFERGAYDDGELLGFGRVATRQPRGSTLVRTFETSRVLRGKPITEELYDAQGELKSLRVYVHASPLFPPTAPEVDLVQPFYNPLARVCDVELGTQEAAGMPAPEIEAYVSWCRWFDDEEPPSTLVLGPGRTYVTAYRYDATIGRIVEKRDLRDVQLEADTLIHEYGWSTWQPHLGGPRLEHETTRDASGTIFQDVSYEDFAHGEWRRKVEHDPLTGAIRDVRRTFTPSGNVDREIDAHGHVTDHDYGCGGVLIRSTDPLGYADEHVLDDACRLIEKRKLFGGTTIARTTYARDGQGRAITTTTDAATGSSNDAEIVESTVYDAEAPATTPARVTIQPEPDGSTTLHKLYLDAWGRTVRTVRCSLGSEASGGAAGLDATYPCAGNDVIVINGYDGETGDLVTTVGPYREGDALIPSHGYEYDELGRLRVHHQPDGTTLAYGYFLGRRTITDALDRTTEIVYDTLDEDVMIDGQYRGGTRRDAFGRIVATIDAAGNATLYEYDGYNRKISEQLPAVEVLPSGAGLPYVTALVTRWTYDDADLPVQETDRGGVATTLTYDVGHRVSTTSRAGALIEERIYSDGAYGTRAVIVSDPRLRVAREEHLDGLGRVWKQIAFDGTVTTIDHDGRGRPWRTTLPWGEVRTSEIQEAGLYRVDTVTEGGVVAQTVTELDAEGRPLFVTDADDQVISHEYDVMGRLTTTWQGQRELEHVVYDVVGRRAQVRSAGATTCFTYDDLDQPVVEERGCDPSLTPRALVTIERTYTPLGQVASEWDGVGNRTLHEYDALARLRSIEVIDASGVSHGARRFGYDAYGRETLRVDELMHEHRTGYDDEGRVVSTQPSGSEPITTWYEAVDGSWVATTATPTGEVAVTHTDAMGRVWRACRPDEVCDEHTYVDGLRVATRRFDVSGALHATRHVQYHASSRRIAREWDWLGATEEAARCSGDIPDSCELPSVERGWTYAGRPAWVADAQGNVVTYHYETADHSLLPAGVSHSGLASRMLVHDPTYPIVVERRSVDPAGVEPDLVETIEWERALRPRIVARSGGAIDETLFFGYDDAGRRDLSRLERGGDLVQIAETFDVRGNTTTRSYDVTVRGTTWSYGLGFGWRDDGQLESVAYPTGHTAAYQYDPQGLLAGVLLNGAVVWEAADFDASGRARAFVFDGGAVVIERAFDPAGRGREISRAIDGVEPTSRVEEYQYDAAGRLAAILAGADSAHYAYDARDSLTDEIHFLDGTKRRLRYVYDPLTGLRVQKEDLDAPGGAVTTAYEYDAGHRLAVVNGTPIAWDGHGRQITDAAGRIFQWGAADQLLAIDGASGNLETNLHDAAGLRVARTSPFDTEIFLAGHDGTLVQISGAGTQAFVRLPGGAVIATFDETGTVTPVVEDITGSPYRIGELAAAHRHTDRSAFGETLVDDAGFDTDLSFHGMFESQAPGILIAGVRAYDVGTGRFLTPDPLGLASAPDIVEAADPFRYAHDNPIALRDPGGRSPCFQTMTGGCTPNLGDELNDSQQHQALIARGTRSLMDKKITRALQGRANLYHRFIRGIDDGRKLERFRSVVSRISHRFTELGRPVTRDASNADGESAKPLHWAEDIAAGTDITGPPVFDGGDDVQIDPIADEGLLEPPAATGAGDLRTPTKNATKDFESEWERQAAKYRGYFILDGPADSNLFSLTFDDGPDFIPEILAELKNHPNVRVTFFFIEEDLDAALKQDPDILRKIVAGGHTIAIHGRGHKPEHNMRLSPDEFLREQVLPMRQKIYDNGGGMTSLYRPAGGEITDGQIEALIAIGMYVVNWSVDSRDVWAGGNDPQSVVKSVMEHAHPGGIALAHERAWTVKALPRLIEALEDRGYTLVPLEELLRLPPPVTTLPE